MCRSTIEQHLLIGDEIPMCGGGNYQMLKQARTKAPGKQSNFGEVERSSTRKQFHKPGQPERVNEQHERGSKNHLLSRLQRSHGNQAVQRLVRGRAQRELEVGKPDDKYEREADRVAEKVMRMPDSATNEGPKEDGVDTRVQRMCLRCRKRFQLGKPLNCTGCETELNSGESTWSSRIERPRLQRTCACGARAAGGEGERRRKGRLQQTVASHSPTPEGVSPLVSEVLQSPGQPLDLATRVFMESGFGHDFSQVRIHTDPRAAESARMMNARAFTVGRNVVFGAGEYAPQTPGGRRLLAHELTHTLQQRNDEKAIQCQERQEVPRRETVQEEEQVRSPGEQANSTDRIGYYVVRDRGLDAGGGTYVDDLETLRTRLQTFRSSEQWTLVLSIHGGEERLAAQSPPNWQQNVRYYGPSEIRNIFGNDQAFVRWRDRWGPTRLVLNACTVGASFERVLIENLTRIPAGASSRTQGAQGLGTDCKPLTTTHTLGSRAQTLQRWQRLPEAQRTRELELLRDLNRRWGYFGQPPVPDEHVLHYYFNEEPSPGWPTIEVMKEQGGVLTSLSPPVPFYNRMSHSSFLRACNQGFGGPRERRPRLPPPTN